MSAGAPHRVPEPHSPPRGSLRTSGAGGRVRRGHFSNQRKEEEEMSRYCHHSCRAYSGSSAPSQTETLVSERGASPSPPGVARGSARPHCEYRSVPHPTHSIRSRAGQPLRHEWEAAVSHRCHGVPRDRDGGVLPAPLFVHPCHLRPPCRCYAQLSAARRLCLAPGKSGAFLGTGKGSPRLAGCY